LGIRLAPDLYPYRERIGVTPRSLVVVLTVLVALSAPASAAAQDPPLVNWPSLLPGLESTYQPSSGDDCRSGRPGCIDALIREMAKRFNPLATSCDHDAIFGLSYLRTTQAFQQALGEPGFFNDARYITHEGAVFASMYMDAYDTWHSRNRAATPAAWAIAFDAAANRRVSAAGNLLLGMNAHIQHDRPFVLAAVGLVEPDGMSRKEDNDEVNVFLNRVGVPLTKEIAARFDPSFDDTNVPTTLDDLLTFEPVMLWREIAWRNAERLVAARTDAERAIVAADIERYAASQALLIRSLSAYLAPLQTSAPRDAFCAVNHG
jgi:hypothetical protein